MMILHKCITFSKSFANFVLNYDFHHIRKSRCIKIKMYSSIFM